MNTVTAKRDLLDNCRNSEYREALVFENVYTGVCSQIRVLREQRELSQAEFGRKAKMAQERISILEDPNAETKPTLKTLLRVASAFDVGLDVRFVPFETVLDRSVNTDSSALQVPSFDDELPELEKHLDAVEARSRERLSLTGLGMEQIEAAKAIQAYPAEPRRLSDTYKVEISKFSEPVTTSSWPLQIVYRNPNLEWRVSKSLEARSGVEYRTTQIVEERTA